MRRTTVRKSNSLSLALVPFIVLICIMVSAPLLSASSAPFTSISIVNNSSKEVRHVYLSPPNSNNWGTDQLVNSVIPANGGTFTISNASCSGSGIKVIAEDQDGCFIYQVVSCSESVTWTITNSATRDCGGSN